MAVFALIAAGAVANLALYADEADAPEDAVDVTALSPRPEIGWGYDGKAFAAPAVTVPVSDLSAALLTAASDACSAIRDQVVPDATHSDAYTNAAAIVAANAGGAPTADPFKTVFAQLGASVGISDPEIFAKVVMAVSLASMQLATILATLKGATAVAKAPADLAAALSAFEASIAGFVAQLDAAGLTAPITVPSAIVIPGIDG